MTDQTEIMRFLHAPGGGVGYGIYTADVTTDDTVTLDDFNELYHAYAIKLQDNSEATVTIATNVVTVTQAALSDDTLLIFVQGV